MAKAKLAIKMAASESKDVAKVVDRLREALIGVLQIDNVTTISISDDNKLTINGGLDDFFIDTSDEEPELTLFDTPDNTPDDEVTAPEELAPLTPFGEFLAAQSQEIIDVMTSIECTINSEEGQPNITTFVSENDENAYFHIKNLIGFFFNALRSEDMTEEAVTAITDKAQAAKDEFDELLFTDFKGLEDILMLIEKHKQKASEVIPTLSPLARAFLDHPELINLVEERDHPLNYMDLSEMDTIFNGLYPDDETEERCSLRHAYNDNREHDFIDVYDEIARYRCMDVEDILNESGTDAGEIPKPSDVE